MARNRDKDTVGGSFFEQMIESTNRTEKMLVEILGRMDANDDDGALCPLCEAARNGLESMLDSLRRTRGTTVVATTNNTEAAHNMAISALAMSESYRLHVSFVLYMLDTAHDMMAVLDEGPAVTVLSVDDRNESFPQSSEYGTWGSDDDRKRRAN